MGVAEARFYRDLAREVPRARPAGAGSPTTDGDDRYVMVLEDLEAAAAASRRPTTPTSSPRAATSSSSSPRCTRSTGSRRASTTAATSRGSRRRAPGDGGGGAKFVQMAIDNLGDRLARGLPPARRALRRTRTRHRARCEREGRARSCTATRTSATCSSTSRRRPHRLPRLGDDRPLARAARRRVRAVQLDPRRGPRAPTSATLVERYCELLGADGVDARRRRRRGSSTGCSRSTRGCAATSTAGMGSKWQPVHIGLGGTERATTAACEHLDCVELLERLLG